MLSCLKVSLLRSLHNPADNAHSMGNVGSGLGEKEELADQHAIEGGIYGWSGRVLRQSETFGEWDVGGCTVLHVKQVKDTDGVVGLVHTQTGVVSLELNPQILVDRTQVVSSEGTVKVVFELVDEGEIATRDENIININQKSNSVIVHMSEVEIRVRVGLSEVPGEKSLMKASIPCTGALLKSIECLVEPTHQMFGARLNKAERLMHVDFLFQDAVQESSKDV